MAVVMLHRPTSVSSDASVDHAPLGCVVCHEPFDFINGEIAVVLRHVAYGYDFTHAGSCLETALEWIFVEPGYDTAAFSLDTERKRILSTTPADGWAAVMPEAPERVLGGSSVRFEALSTWALVEHVDGSRRLEGIIRDADLEGEPGGARFPEAGLRPSIGYASPADQRSASRRAHWEALIQARYRGAATRAA